MVLCILSLILKALLGDSCSFLHFMDEKTETQKVQVIQPKLQTMDWNLGLFIQNQCYNPHLWTEGLEPLLPGM